MGKKRKNKVTYLQQIRKTAKRICKIPRPKTALGTMILLILVAVIGGLILDSLNSTEPPDDLLPEDFKESFGNLDLQYHFRDIEYDEYASNYSIEFIINSNTVISNVRFYLNKSDSITYSIFNNNEFDGENNDILNKNMKAYPRLTVAVPKSIPKQNKWIQLTISFKNTTVNNLITESKKIFLESTLINFDNYSFFLIDDDIDAIPNKLYNTKSGVNTDVKQLDNTSYYLDVDGDKMGEIIYSPIGNTFTVITEPSEELPLWCILIVVVILIILITVGVLFKTGYLYFEEEDNKESNKKRKK